MPFGSAIIGSWTIGGPTIRAPFAVAPSLLMSVSERARSTSALMDLLPGGFHTGKAPDTAIDAGAYGVLTEVGGRPRFTTAGRTGYHQDYQASFFGPDGDVISGDVGPAFLNTFKVTMVPLEVAGQYMIACFPTTEPRMAPDDEPDNLGNPLWHQVVEFRVMMGLSDPS